MYDDILGPKENKVITVIYCPYIPLTTTRTKIEPKIRTLKPRPRMLKVKWNSELRRELNLWLAMVDNEEYSMLKDMNEC